MKNFLLILCFCGCINVNAKSAISEGIASIEIYAVDPAEKTFTGYKKEDVIEFAFDKKKGSHSRYKVLKNRSDVVRFSALLKKLNFCEKYGELDVDVRILVVISYTHKPKRNLLISSLDNQQIFMENGLYERNSELYKYLLLTLGYRGNYLEKVVDIKNCHLDIDGS